MWAGLDNQRTIRKYHDGQIRVKRAREHHDEKAGHEITRFLPADELQRGAYHIGCGGYGAGHYGTSSATQVEVGAGERLVNRALINIHYQAGLVVP